MATILPFPSSGRILPDGERVEDFEARCEAGRASSANALIQGHADVHVISAALLHLRAALDGLRADVVALRERLDDLEH